MSLSVFASPSGNDPRMFLDLNGQDYKIYFDYSAQEYYDIVIFGGPTSMSSIPNCSLKLELQIWHNHENQSLFKTGQPIDARRSSNDTVILTNAFDPIVEHANWVVENDFLFNRTKAYYLNYPFNSETRRWYYAGMGAYVLPEINSDQNKQKIFVSPNNTYSGNTNRKIKYRPKIVEIVKSYNDLGHVGNHDVDKNLILYPQLEFPDCQDIRQIETARHSPRHGLLGYNPPHNEYYKNTFISIYGETIEFGSTIAVTEKTYDPLIKGHFILPFSNCGFISYLKSKGFKFPEFINYGYDSIVDDDLRFDAYAQEIHRLLMIPIDQWKQLWSDNFDIIQSNRDKFVSGPFDRVDLAKYL